MMINHVKNKVQAFQRSKTCPLVTKKWFNQEFEPISSREWHRKPYAESFITIQPQIAKLWPKMVIPLVAKKWTNQKNDPTVSREWQNYAYTVNFIEIGQQMPKLWPKRCPWWPKNELFLNLMAPLKPSWKKKLILKISEFYLKKRQNESLSGAHIWESCSPL